MRRRCSGLWIGMVLLPGLVGVAGAATPRLVPVPEGVEPSPLVSPAGEPARVNLPQLFFAGTRPGETARLWQTDGKEQAHPVWSEDGDELEAPRFLASSTRWMYFAATPSNQASALYRTDGTVAERLVEAPVVRGLAGEGRLFFTTTTEAGEALWTTDGTAAGTLRTDVVIPPQAPWLSFRNTLLFAGSGPNGIEPWRTDATAAGTHELADLIAGPAGSHPGAFAVVGETAIFFSFADSAAGILWRTEGTTPRTVLPFPVSAGDTPFARGAYGFERRMYVRARGTEGSWSMWGSDGTPAGTTALASLTPEQLEAPLRGAGSTVYFIAQHASGPMLYASEGSPASTRPILAAGLPVLADRGTQVYFALDSIHLAGTDGTTVGTGSLALPAEVGALVPSVFEVAADTLFFTARATPEAPPRLWALDLPDRAERAIAPAVAETAPEVSTPEEESEGCDCNAKDFFSPFLGLFAYAFVRRPTKRQPACPREPSE